MAGRLKELSYFDLKGIKKAAAFRGNFALEKKIQKEMSRRVENDEVTEEEMVAAAYL